MKPGDAALAIAERLLDPDRVVATAPSYGIATLADGLPGTALLHARLSAVDPVFAAAASAHWNAAAEHAVSASQQGPGIYGAMGGLAASLVLGSPYLPDPEVTATATARSVRWLSARAVESANLYTQATLMGRPGTAWHVYDTISGLAGIGRILLAALIDGHSSAEPGLFAAQTAMTRMLTDHGGALPGWWVPTDQHPQVVAAHLDPTGAADTGLAHGVAGPLAVLALAHSTGHSVAGQEAAIRDAVRWLGRWRVDDHGWPDHATGQQLSEDKKPTRHGRRTAWCYGVPGVARSLLLAASALDDHDLGEAARTDLRRLGAENSVWDAVGPTLCHGHAGVLSCAHGIDRDVTERAASGVMRSLEPGRPFLVTHMEHSASHDNPGFLTGATGVALALSAFGELPASPINASWDALLLIA